ncbi:NAD-dependent epimerase/dehydratase family protein [Candidatus Pelagibacter sp. Uisw_127]|uniref:NAD-dependent epimerase/dehydratase family protein n=1 Tax=Candidatus Pelagibacter sp. Uisw_127 TaxID=3230988 RepID=UPI0039E8EE68
MKKILICGAGGFIGGHLAKKFINDKNYQLVCADIKPLEYWFQTFDSAENHCLDLKDYNNTLKVTKNVDYIFNLACNMGGMGFIENNKAECMLSVLINTNLLRAAIKNKCEKYLFSSSACVYNGSKQNETFIPGLKETDAYPAEPEDGYGWEKLFSERMCRHFTEDFGLETRVVRFHNIYGPVGTFDGGREKAPAALCRKIINAKNKNLKKIDVWGDGEQTRSFLYISDCIDGMLEVFNSNSTEVFNIGSEEQVSINQMIDTIENIAAHKVDKNYQLDKPLGVRGRSSDNSYVTKKIGWKPKTTLKEGLVKTHQWISQQISSGTNIDKFCKSNIEK